MTAHTIDAHRAPAPHAETALSTTAAGFSIAAAITLVFNAALTIAKDAYEPLHALFQGLMGHHWITHGVVDIVVFVVLGLLLSRSEAVRKLSDTAVIGSVVAATVINGAAIALWFLLF